MLEAVLIRTRSDALIFGGSVIATFLALFGWSFWATRFGPEKYRGRRVFNWNKAQRDETRERMRLKREGEHQG